MELRLEQSLPASAEMVWPLITSPPWMNQWSLAKVELVAAGDGGTPDGIGTYRKIIINAWGRTTVLKEVIVDAAPPHKLVYRVFDSPPIEHHRGEITLQPTPEGCKLVWQVKADYAVQGIEWFTKGLLQKQLRQSLWTMADVAKTLRQEDLPPPHHRVLSPPTEIELVSCWQNAEAILQTQEQLAETLQRDDDPKQWFARVYAFVTALQLEACRDGNVTHVDWVLRLIPLFHVYYFDNLQRWRGLLPDPPEGHWQDAFATMEGQRGRHKRSPTATLFVGLYKGIRAHIVEDLPRVLAQVYVQHYKGRCDYDRFRADYLLMGGIFRRASERLYPHLPELPWAMRVGNDGLLGLWKQRKSEQFFPIARARWEAFERGKLLTTFDPHTKHFDPSAASATVDADNNPE